MGNNQVVRESVPLADAYTASLVYRTLLRSIRVYWCLRVNVQEICISRFVERFCVPLWNKRALR